MRVKKLFGTGSAIGVITDGTIIEVLAAGLIDVGKIENEANRKIVVWGQPKNLPAGALCQCQSLYCTRFPAGLTLSDIAIPVRAEDR